MKLAPLFFLCLSAALVVPDAFAAIESVVMPGKVIAGHADLESDCKQCHVRFNKSAQTGLCRDCHKEVKHDITHKTGYHGRITEQECRACHTEHKGRDFNIAAVDKRRFDHNLTDYPLKGGHTGSKVACSDCHEQGKKWREAPDKCEACHKKDDKHKGSLGNSCGNCHVEQSWKQVRFDHSKTKFELIGKHAPVKCNQCHDDPTFKGAPSDCFSCHKKDDKHKRRYGEKCESCHTAKEWDVLVFDHDRDTKYPLFGRHRQTKCDSCHTGPLYNNPLKKECIACHTKDDKHKGEQGKQCQNCHNEGNWKEARFDHDFARFPLLGKHAKIECKKCHTSPIFKKTEMTCVGCHRKKDAHKGRLGTQCELCHNARNWKEWQYDHNARTRFHLDGGHKGLKCEECHKRIGVRTPSLSGACGSCHQTDDVHNSSFGQQCERCHLSSSWEKLRPGVTSGR